MFPVSERGVFPASYLTIEWGAAEVPQQTGGQSLWGWSPRPCLHLPLSLPAPALPIWSPPCTETRASSFRYQQQGGCWSSGLSLPGTHLGRGQGQVLFSWEVAWVQRSPGLSSQVAAMSGTWLPQRRWSQAASPLLLHPRQARAALCPSGVKRGSDRPVCFCPLLLLGALVSRVHSHPPCGQPCFFLFLPHLQC